MTHTFYSVRAGKNKNLKGLSLEQFKTVFLRTYTGLLKDGYFTESFGFSCVDLGLVEGKNRDVDLDILLKIRKEKLWPIEDEINSYSEDDLFDIIEYLFLYVSKPIDGTPHNYNDCGMHWETFNKHEGQSKYREKINEILLIYHDPFELSDNGEVLQKPDKGFEKIFEANVPSEDENINKRYDSALLTYRRHGSTLDDRRQAVRDLADILEYLRPKVSKLLPKQDEKDLFNLANNFGIRHHNDKQKTNYDTALWLSWMFYYYLATIHVLLRKLEKQKLNK